MNEIDDSDRANLSEAPLAYLETYPYPAFVLLIPSRDDRNASGPSRRTIAWRNDKWLKWSVGSDIDNLFDSEPLHAIEEWIDSREETVFPIKSAEETLHLVKSIIPSRQASSPHELCVVTSVPAYPIKSYVASRRETLVPPTRSSSPGTPMPLNNGGRDSPDAFALDSPPAPITPVTPRLDCKTLMQTTDWSQTKLGPREKWSSVIHHMLEVVLRSPTQDALWLGEDFQMVYNDNYGQIVDHPRMYGRSAKAKEAWGPVWDGVSGLIDRCLQFGENVYREDDLLLYRRGPRGHWVEKYHTWSFIPLFDDDGKPLGLYNPTRETTAAVVARRRQESTRDLSEQLLIARNQREFYDGITEVLERNAKDVPFLIGYSVEEDKDDGQVKLSLQATVGVPEDHPAAEPAISLSLSHGRHSRQNLGPKAAALSSPTLSAISALSSGAGRVNYSYDKKAWPIAKALATRQAIVVDDCSELIQGFPLREWEALPYSAIVVPVASESSTEVPHAVLIIGLNVASPLDEEYEDWIHVIRAHLTSSLASVRAYEAENQNRLEREGMERAKTAWFQGAAHDLRSPLTLVAGPLDDILRTNLHPDQRSALQLAQRNLARVQRLVNSLLDFSRIEAGKMQGRFAPLDLGRFVDSLATLFRPAVERRRITYELDIDRNERTVFVDPTLLETVITNLISNALKYTERGTITVGLSYDNGFAEIAVTDSGIGIPQAELAAVTDRFHRATTALSRGTEGTGIGLALAKEIVKLHGGDLLITSQTSEESGGPHGSTFTARIPLIERRVNEDGLARAAFGLYGKEVVAEAMCWALDSDIESESVGSGMSGLSGSLSSRADGFLFEKTDVLLLVDDNTDMRHYIKRLFAPYCRVIEAKNGKEAFDIARANPPQLILSDLMMPIMNGQELLTEIRNDPATKMVPMVLLSAATDDELRLAALIEGAEDFLTKPFKPKELLARVHLHMQLGKKRVTLEALYEQREREMSVLADYCPSGILRANADGFITYGNGMWRTIAGMPPGFDINGWANYVDEDTYSRLAPFWEKGLHGDETTFSDTWRFTNGKTVQGTFIRLDKVDPTLSGILGCLSDISYQEEKLLDAERRRIEAEESKHQQELLVDLTSHEIRTPVSAILQCSSLVKDNLVVLQEQLKTTGTTGFRATPQLMTDLEEDIEALESIYQCGLVQERIANDVLSLARVQLDMLTLHDFDMDLRKEAKKIVSVFASEAKMKKISLVLEFGQNIDRTGTAVVKTDHVRLHQVVTNLISNAIRFTASSPTRVITVQYEVSFFPPDDNTCAPPVEHATPVKLPVPENTPVWLFVAVRDTGPGLGPQEQAALFRRFSQGNKMIHTKYGGSGLGLFICKRISELLGGRIEMTSELGKGSVFRFFIQTRTGPPKLTQEALEESTAALRISNPTVSKPTPTLEPAAPTRQATSDLHLLVVEDNIINQTVLKRQIIKAGLTCDVANNGQEALDQLNEAHRQSLLPNPAKRAYDVVLMDLEMPVMDGLTAVKHIRESEANGSLKKQIVIALTGNARQGQIDQARAAGMDDVVIKPYRLNDLIAKLRKEVSERRDRV